MWHPLLLCFVLVLQAFVLCHAHSAHSVTISNAEPRRDTNGDIVAGGDGNLIQFHAGKRDLKGNNKERADKEGKRKNPTKIGD